MKFTTQRTSQLLSVRHLIAMKANQDIHECKEKQLCLGCMAPNKPSAHFCIKCGAPLTSYAATGPFESLFAEGHVYRQAAERPQKLIVVIGVWFLFGTMALIGIGMLIGHKSLVIDLVVGVLMLAISVLVIWKTTRNYLGRCKSSENNNHLTRRSRNQKVDEGCSWLR